jgi:hypothetical protein
MTTYSWTGGNDDWGTPTDWTPGGPPNDPTADAVIAPAGNDTITIAAGESFLIDSLTFDPASSTTLALNGTLTLGGTQAAMTVSSGSVEIAGTLVGGTLTLRGGLLDGIGNGLISSVFLSEGGTLAIASGETLTLAGAATWDGGMRIDGPGTLVTSGTTTIDATPDLDGGLVWENAGTVLAGAEILTDYPSGSGTVTIGNLTGAAFDLTADGAAFQAYAGAGLLVDNAGVLSKTGGTGTTNIYGRVINTGTITATTGTLELDAGGTLGGTIAETAAGVVNLGAGLFDVTGTIDGPGTLTIDNGASLIIDTVSETIANPVIRDGFIQIAAGNTLTLTGVTPWDGGARIDGPGTLLTTGTTTIDGTSFLDGNLEWDNSGTVLAGAEVIADYPSGAGTVTIDNLAGGVFDLTADGAAFQGYGGAALVLENAGLLSKTGGTGTSNIYTGVTVTGTITATSGTLELDAGGTLSGTLTETATGAVNLGDGLFVLTGTIEGPGTLTIDNVATLSIATVSETIAGPMVLDGAILIAAGDTLTLTGATTWGGSAGIKGSGTLVTTGTTTIDATSSLDNSLVWDNSGTVLAGAQIIADFPSGSGTVTIDNLAGAVFDLTTDGGESEAYAGAGLILDNAGVLAKTGGTGTTTIYTAVTDTATGTITATTGTLALNGGGTLAGTIAETATGVVNLGQGLFALTGTIEGPGTLTIDTLATLAIATAAETIANPAVLDGAILIAAGNTLTLTGATTWGGSALIDGPGTLVTTGTTTIEATSSLDGNLVWTNSGTVLAGAEILADFPSGTGAVTIANQSGAVFDLTADGLTFDPYGVSPPVLDNAGTFAKIGGTGTSTIGFGFTNTGLVDAASGTLRLTAAVGGSGTLGIESGDTLELASGGNAASNTISFNGLGATLRIDTNTAIANPIEGLGGGSRIDLPDAASATAVINGDTLVVTPNGGTALDYVSTGSLANLHVSTGSDGGSGSLVTLYYEAAASVAAPNPVNFGIIHVGDTISHTLGISNLAPAGAFSENLDGSIGGTTGAIVASGSFSGLGGGATDTTDLTVGLDAADTTTAGTISGSATVTLASDGTGIDTFGTTALTQQVVAANATVNNYATATIEELSGGGTFSQTGTTYTLDLGAIGQGTSLAPIDLGILNDVSGPADLLSGSFAVAGSPGFTLTGFDAFAGLTAEQIDSSPSITIATANTGTFTATVTLIPTGSNAGGYTGVLPEEVLIVKDTVVPCFLPGTRIKTIKGEVLVETLRPGDIVVTLNGESRPLVWIGSGKALATRGCRGAATPVIVKKGAFADNVPYHDLRVTKGHAFYLDGVLIPAEFLVNHRSVIWDDRAREVTVFHLELDVHDVLLANGAPAESYRDDGNRWLFQNANSGWDLPPKQPCAPVLTGGAVVDAVWRRLLDRAGPRPGMPLTDDPDLHLLVDGRRLDATVRTGDFHAFNIRDTPCEIRIRSRAAVQQELGLARDPRSLGIAVRQVMVSQRTRFRTLHADDPLLAEGFHAFEPDNGFRWTDGEAVLPAALFGGFTGPFELLLAVGCTTHYVDDEATWCAA